MPLSPFLFAPYNQFISQGLHITYVASSHWLMTSLGG